MCGSLVRIVRYKMQKYEKEPCLFCSTATATAAVRIIALNKQESIDSQVSYSNNHEQLFSSPSILRDYRRTAGTGTTHRSLFLSKVAGMALAAFTTNPLQVNSPMTSRSVLRVGTFYDLIIAKVWCQCLRKLTGDSKCFCS